MSESKADGGGKRHKSGASGIAFLGSAGAFTEKAAIEYFKLQEVQPEVPFARQGFEDAKVRYGLLTGRWMVWISPSSLTVPSIWREVLTVFTCSLCVYRNVPSPTKQEPPLLYSLPTLARNPILTHPLLPF